MDVIFETDSRKKYFKEVGLVILFACQMLISGVYTEKFADFVYYEQMINCFH